MNTHKKTLDGFLSDLKTSKLFKDQIVFTKKIKGMNPTYGEDLEFLNGDIKRLLRKNSIQKLYTHQTEALKLLSQDIDVVVSTPTASGKSLIYNLAVLNYFLKNPSSTALYLFPLKALAQDQLQQLNNFLENLPSNIKKPSLDVYDGDVSYFKRYKLRQRPPNILMSNPDMLHIGILPNYMAWKDFFMNLKFIVVDEVHTYKGVMGSHMAWVFRRLIRICNFYGAYPIFIFCSATIGNPVELVEKLTGRAPVHISKTGSPKGVQEFIFINPMLYGPAKTGFMLLKSAVLRGLRTIVYTNSRKLTELIGAWTKSKLGSLGDRVSVYRAGLLPEDRREIEAKLTKGEIIGVVSTSALEAGINIGGLDLCILVGYPGSVMSFFQRAGRVGRKMQKSGVILIGGEDNLDQYILSHPENFFRLSPENIAINPYNEQIMTKHLMCAATELPIKLTEFNGQREKDYVRKLIEDGILIEDENTKEIYSTDTDIHRKVHIRSSSNNLIILDNNGNIIGTIDKYRAHHETYPGAIYLHNTKTYKVEKLDILEKQVVCKRVDVKYFTKLIVKKSTSILEYYNEKYFKNLKIGYGKLKIKENFLGFEKRRTKDQTLINFNELNLDPIEFETQGMWIQLPVEFKEYSEKKFMHFMGGIHGLEHLLIGVMPYVVLMDRNDIGGISIDFFDKLKSPVVFIYDGVEGGIGISKEGYEKIDVLFSIAKDILNSCDCTMGCFKCIYSPKCGSGNRPLDKECTKYILDLIYGDNKYPDKCKTSHPIKNEITQKDEHINFGVLDIETQKSAKEVGGWKNAHAMRVSCAVLYHRKKNDYLVFYEENIDKLFEELKTLDLIIGYNIKKFDYNVLAPYTSYDLTSLPTLDLLIEIHKRLGYRISLDNVAKATLNVGKSANGLLALKWWKEGNIDKIVKYCIKDVEVTKDVYLFGKNNGFIYFSNKAGKRVRLQVTW